MGSAAGLLKKRSCDHIVKDKKAWHGCCCDQFESLTPPAFTGGRTVSQARSGCPGPPRAPTTVQSLTAFRRLDVAPLGSHHADYPIPAIITIPRFHSGPGHAFAVPLGRRRALRVFPQQVVLQISRDPLAAGVGRDGRRVHKRSSHGEIPDLRGVRLFCPLRTVGETAPVSYPRPFGRGWSTPYALTGSGWLPRTHTLLLSGRSSVDIAMSSVGEPLRIVQSSTFFRPRSLPWVSAAGFRRRDRSRSSQEFPAIECVAGPWTD